MTITEAPPVDPAEAMRMKTAEVVAKAWHLSIDEVTARLRRVDEVKAEGNAEGHPDDTTLAEIETWYGADEDEFDSDYLPTGPVLAGTFWRSNAEMISDLMRLGFLRLDFTTLDPTYGRGVWWKRMRPTSLTLHDFKIDGVNFLDLPHEADTFQQSVFDPDYVSTGGRTTTTLEAKGSDFYDRYGLKASAKSPALLQRTNEEGLREVARVTKPRRRGRDTENGIIVVKCMPYVSSGAVFDAPYFTKKFAREELGLRFVDEGIHLAKSPRMQPSKNRDGSPRAQKHLRRNHSNVLIFQKVA